MIIEVMGVVVLVVGIGSILTDLLTRKRRTMMTVPEQESKDRKDDQAIPVCKCGHYISDHVFSGSCGVLGCMCEMRDPVNQGGST